MAENQTYTFRNYMEHETDPETGRWTWFDRTECGNEESLEYFTPADDGQWIIPGLMLSGDYIGSSVEASNARVFLEQFSGRPGVVEVTGFPGVRGVALNFDLMTDETREEIRETLDTLDNYCVLDSDDMSQLETDRESEAWVDYIAGDLRRAMRKNVTDDDASDRIDELDDEALFEAYIVAADNANVYPEHETGGSVYVDVDRVAECIAYPVATA